jgi:hypothetical protein
LVLWLKTVFHIIKPVAIFRRSKLVANFGSNRVQDSKANSPVERSMVISRYPPSGGSTALLETAVFPNWKGEKDEYTRLMLT